MKRHQNTRTGITPGPYYNTLILLLESVDELYLVLLIAAERPDVLI